MLKLPRVILTLAWVICWICGGSVALGAKKESVRSKVIKEVFIQFANQQSGDGVPFLNRLSSQPGAAYSAEMIERDVKNLYATGGIENVDVHTQDVDGGVKLIFELTLRGIISTITIKGCRWFDEAELLDDIALSKGVRVDDARAFRSQSLIQDRYLADGFAFAKVDYQVKEGETPNHCTVEFTIDEGQRSLVNKIKMEGLTSLHEADVLARVSTKNLLVKEKLGDDIRAVETAMQDRGFVYAKVADVRYDRVDDQHMDLVFVIDQGKPYKIDSVVTSPHPAFKDVKFENLLKVAKGKPYSVSDILGGEKYIADYYGARGYADARVDTSVIPKGPDSIGVLYRIEEGKTWHIRKVNIEGNTKTQDQVIRRELSFFPGGIFDTVAIAESKRRIEALNYFSQVDFRNEATGDPATKDIDITVTERSTGAIQIGSGFDSFIGLRMFIHLNQDNFDLTNETMLGAGMQFRQDLQISTSGIDTNVSLKTHDFAGGTLLIKQSAPSSSAQERVPAVSR